MSTTYEIGEKVRTVKMSFYREGEIVIKYIPKIQVDGKYLPRAYARKTRDKARGRTCNVV